MNQKMLLIQLLQMLAKRILRDVRTSNMNRLAFGHLNINLLRTKFDFLCEQIERLLMFS